MSTVIITGASKGIGKANAAACIEKGDRVINISRTPSSVEGVENQLIDLTKPESEATIASLAKDLAGDGDIILVHNAARLDSDTVSTADATKMREILEINVVAPQVLNHAFLPHMKAGSAIIYVGSTLSEKAVANSYSYVTSKHAMVGMMRATCQDLAGTGIHTACVCPGFTDTEMLRAHVGEDEAVLTSIAGASTFGRLITPEEIADSILFAASNPVINGAVIHANLGQLET